MKYTLGNGFWSRRIRQVTEKMIPLQLSILKDEAPGTEPSHAIENFRIAAGLKEGDFHGMVFQDSDIGKWIEAAAYSLKLKKDPALEKEIDDIVDIIEKAQMPDGYLNTFFTLKEKGRRWTNLQDCHELYCFGHLTEGAVAYHQATGKTKFLEIMCRFADHIDTVLGPEENKLHGYPGHPEAELALYRLYLETGNEKYLKLSRFFIDQRGTEPNFFRGEWERRGQINHWTGRPAALNLIYTQAHMPVRQQKEAVGHAVRALYLYTGMADIAAQTGDKTLAAACEALWDSAVNRKMYVTGGLGATAMGEAFMCDWELPNDTAYAETCASVALCFFARAMSRLKTDGVLDDMVERELFNVIPAGVSLNADRFYYVNPLEAVQGVSGKEKGLEHALPARPKWFACACCPPNVARLMTSLYEYSAREIDGGIVLSQYLDFEGVQRPKVVSMSDAAHGSFTTCQVEFTPSLDLDAYSGPGTNYMRGADGRAYMSSNESAYVYGSENGYVLVQYHVSGNQWRFAYVSSRLVSSGSVPPLNLQRRAAIVQEATVVTDDPLHSQTEFTTVGGGTTVTVLANLDNWAYIEYDNVRGFIPFSSLR